MDDNDFERVTPQKKAKIQREAGRLAIRRYMNYDSSGNNVEKIVHELFPIPMKLREVKLTNTTFYRWNPDTGHVEAKVNMAVWRIADWAIGLMTRWDIEQIHDLILNPYE